jgi:hypothetical protein
MQVSGYGLPRILLLGTWVNRTTFTNDSECAHKTSRKRATPAKVEGVSMASENRYEEQPFDVVARGLASGTMSRRRALKIMIAGGVGALLSMMAAGEVAAKPPCRQMGQHCNERLPCCSHNESGNPLGCLPVNKGEPGQEERGIKACFIVGPPE